MVLPVGRIDAGIRNRVAAVNHHAVANIDANVRRADGIIGFFKEDQVTRLCICRRNVAALAAQSVCCRASDIPAIAAVIDDPADKARAIKTGAGRTSAPHIRHTQILFGFCNHPCKLFIRQGFFWNIISETTAGTAACSPEPPEPMLPVVPPLYVGEPAPNSSGRLP